MSVENRSLLTEETWRTETRLGVALLLFSRVLLLDCTGEDTALSVVTPAGS